MRGGSKERGGPPCKETVRTAAVSATAAVVFTSILLYNNQRG